MAVGRVDFVSVQAHQRLDGGSPERDQRHERTFAGNPVDAVPASRGREVCFRNWRAPAISNARGSTWQRSASAEDIRSPSYCTGCSGEDRTVTDQTVQRSNSCAPADRQAGPAATDPAARWVSGPRPKGRGRSLDYRPRTLVPKLRVSAATSQGRCADPSARGRQGAQAHASGDTAVNGWKPGGTLPRSRTTTRIWLGQSRPFTCRAVS